MSKIEFNSKSEVAVKPSKPAIAKKEPIKAKGFREKQPCQFNITDNGDGTITAVSRYETFTGTHKEFNERLRA